MPLTKQLVEEALTAALEKKEQIRDQLNACLGFIQACQKILEEADKPEKEA